MNKRIILGLVSLSFLASFKPAVAMHGRVLRGVQIVTSGAVIGVGAKKAYDLDQEIQKPINAPEAPEKVKCMVHEGLAKLNVPNYKEVPVLQFSYQDSPWAVLSDKVIVVHPEIAAAIVSGNEEIIAQSEMLKKHEFKHLLNGDVQKKAYSLVAAPCVVQAAGSGLTYSFNRIVDRKQPKTLLSLTGRSLVAVGAIGPKFFISNLGVIAYIRYQEAQADRFACEHAESREELETFKNLWGNQAAMYEQVMSQQANYVYADEKQRNRMVRIFQFTDDREHPYPGDRAEMVQKYIDKWDAEHSA